MEAGRRGEDVKRAGEHEEGDRGCRGPSERERGPSTIQGLPSTEKINSQKI